ncbi:hypothetical protein DFH08DRAFT_795624 [Mycena albidolilacea]|uniref:Uncharacterized protein n=1 Tax=Mycena albidolilacea TaxID=1033008 RepID=A0AAD7AT34_9AGAR|nr:hypothetical protein DFH08DRAFT_795624 [Mycena albidolilacea]
MDTTHVSLRRAGVSSALPFGLVPIERSRITDLDAQILLRQAEREDESPADLRETAGSGTTRFLQSPVLTLLNEIIAEIFIYCIGTYCWLILRATCAPTLLWNRTSSGTSLTRFNNTSSGTAQCCDAQIPASSFLAALDNIHPVSSDISPDWNICDKPPTQRQQPLQSLHHIILQRHAPTQTTTLQTSGFLSGSAGKIHWRDKTFEIGGRTKKWKKVESSGG